MIKKNKANLFLLLILIIFLIIGIIPKKQNNYKKTSSLIENPHDITGDETLRVGTPYRNNILNPFNDGGNNISLITKLTNTSLFTVDKNDKFQKKLVDKFWYDDMGKTISIVLKKGMKFSNGEEIKAYHIKNTYSILANPNYDGSYSTYVDNLKGYYSYKLGKSDKLEGIEILGDYYIKFHFNVGDFSNINTLTFPILDVDDDYIDYEKYSNMEFKNGGGYYKVSKIENLKVYLELKAEYKNDIALKKIEIFNLYPQEAIEMYKRGDIDIVYKYKNTLNYMSNTNDRIKQYSYSISNQSPFFHFLGFNQNSEIFKIEKNRRLLSDFLDMQDIVGSSVGSYAYNFSRLPIFGNSWFNLTKNVDDEKTNKIEKLYFEDVKKPIIIKLIALENDDFFKNIEAKFKEYIENEYIKLDIRYLSSQEMYKSLKDGEKFDIFISQRNMTDIPKVLLEDKYPVESELDLVNLADESFFYIMSKIQEDTDNPLIKKMKLEWHTNFRKKTPYIVLANENITTIINKRISGIYINEFVGLDYIENLRNIRLKHN